MLCQSFTLLHPPKTAKRIEVLFGVETLGDPKNIVLEEEEEEEEEEEDFA